MVRQSQKATKASEKQEGITVYDVAIIGAGITGCAIAYELGKYNVKAVIVEKERTGTC